MSRVWITWEQQRRNQTMAAAFDAKLILMDVAASRPVRYAICTVRTLHAIASNKPSVVFVQNPSFVLVVVAATVCSIAGIPFVIDAHNSAIFPLDGKSRFLTWATNKLNRAATLVIVSNDRLKMAETSAGANVVSLPDPLPEIHCASPAELRAPRNILFVCSWAVDEPFLNVIEAGRFLSPDICIHVTGNHSKPHLRLPQDIPPNVNLTGFLSAAEYDCLLRAVDVVVDLTTYDDCLVCGAYEGVSASKPLILSDTKVNRSYFDKGTLYTDNSARDVARQIVQALDEIPRLTAEVEGLKLNLESDWRARKHEIETVLQEVSRPVTTARRAPR